MIAVVLRLILGRESLVRLIVTAAGVALGAVLLLFAAVANPALHAHDVRAAWTTTSAHNVRPAQNEAGADGLLWRINDLDHPERFGNRFVVRVDLAALGPKAPVPPGLTRLPGPGELAVSPALARLMATTAPDRFADRFPGRVVETVGDAALIGPGDLVVFVGHDPARLRAAGDVVVVHSIEAEPLRHSYDVFLRFMLIIGVLGLLLPVVVLVGTATRLAAARREQRLAALRLVGATPAQISLLAAAEAGVAAATGTALGFAGFTFLARYAVRIPFDGHTFLPGDVRLSPWLAALTAVGVPALAIVAALISLRRVRVSPLGVTRQAARPRPTWRRLLVLAVGLIAFAIAVPIAFGSGRQDTSTSVALGVAFATVVAGIVIAGPWMTVVVGQVMSRLGHRPAALLAARRLQDNPTAAFRSVSGLILAVFVASLISGLTPVALGGHSGNPTALPAGAVAEELVGYRAGPDREAGLDPAQATLLVARLTAIPGVTRVFQAHTAPADIARLFRADPTTKGIPAGKFMVPDVTRCADLRAGHLGDCTDPTATVVVEGNDMAEPAGRGTAPVVPVPPASLPRLPLAGLVAFTDGTTGTMDRVRTTMAAATPARRVAIHTLTDLAAQRDHGRVTIQRLVSAVLLLTLLIAGCSLAVAVAGGLLERKRPFALLRLTGASPADLNKVALTETAAPLLTASVISAGLGLAMAALILESAVDKSGHSPWKPPDPLYFAALGGGLLLAILITATTALPLLAKLTSLENARFE